MHLLELGARFALFCERTQSLSELNEGAVLLWRRASGGEPLRDLMQDNPAVEDAPAAIAAQLEQWQALGYLAPVEAWRAVDQAPHASMRVRIGAVDCEIRFHLGAEAGHSMEAFSDLRAQGAAHVDRLDVIGLGGQDFIFLNGAPIGADAPRRTAPRLKALLTRMYCDATADGLLAHAALVSRGDKRLCLLGSPGSGKTTLSLALAGAGFEVCSDDIVHFDEAGLALGAGFPAAVKSGAWPLLAPLVSLDRLPVHEREDGQLTKYAPHRARTNQRAAIGAFLLLDRQPGASAHVAPLEPLPVMCAILESAYSKRGAITIRALRGLAGQCASAICGRLVYDDLGGAVAAVESMWGE